MTEPAPILTSASFKAVILDWGSTLSDSLYFTYSPPECPNLPRIVQETVFSHESISHGWMTGKIAFRDIVDLVAHAAQLTHERTELCLRMGLNVIVLNPHVYQFAKDAKRHGMFVSLVTANFDVFDQYVRPMFPLDDTFDVIVNSANHGTLDKARLWPLAFRASGQSIGYSDSFLVEDGRPATLFRELGGMSYEYGRDELFGQWVEANWRWSVQKESH